jgi:hypothetical protein
VRKGAQSMEGCRCFGERLADLETVMADKESTHVETLGNPFDFNKRPVHVAFLHKRLPCAHHFCSKNVIFFEESGLDHHMRTIHRTKLNDGDVKAARVLFNVLHGEETARCLKELFHLRSTQVLLRNHFM